MTPPAFARFNARLARGVLQQICGFLTGTSSGILPLFDPSKIMSEEISVLLEVTGILDAARIDYMLTGSVAMNFYATPRMTRDIDLVAVVALADVGRITDSFPSDRYYVAAEAIHDAVVHQSSFNLLHQNSMVKVDVMVRKGSEFRLLEFQRRRQIRLRDRPVWIVSREDLILSKLDWARDSLSERQLDDVRNLLASDCDMPYILEWSAKLQLTDMLTRALA